MLRLILLREPVKLNIKSHPKQRVSNLDAVLIQGIKVVEEVESVVDYNRAHVHVPDRVKLICIPFLFLRPPNWDYLKLLKTSLRVDELKQAVAVLRGGSKRIIQRRRAQKVYFRV